MPTTRWVLGAAIPLALLLTALAGCNAGGSDGKEQLEYVSVRRGSLSVAITAIGSVSPRAEVTLSFGAAGAVRETFVGAGERVQRGQALSSLDTGDLELQVQNAQAALDAAQARLQQLEEGPGSEQIAIARANLAAAASRVAGAEATRRELEIGATEEQIAAAEADRDAAQASLWLAEVRQDQIERGASTAEIAAARAQLSAALLEQKVARDRHDQTLRCESISLPGGGQQEVCPALGAPEEQARFGVAAADEAVAAAQARLNQLLATPTQDQVEAAAAEVAAAQARVDAALAQLTALQAGSTATQVEAAQANVDALAAQRDAAQAQLDGLLAGPTQGEIATAKANMAQAQVALDRARLALQKATLRAPFAGAVARVDGEPGQFIGPQTPVITLVDDQSFHIDVDVDEADIGWVHPGQEVQLTLDAFPARTLAGRVVGIASQATYDTGVVAYPVTIEISPSDLLLRAGMTVSAEILTQHRDDVLLVPNRAVWIDAKTGQPFVEKLMEDQIVPIGIEQGLANEQFSEVLQGLHEGDELVVRTASVRDRFREMMTRSMGSQ